MALSHFHVLRVFIKFTSRVGWFSTPPPNLIWQALFLFNLADRAVKLVFTREGVWEQQGQPQLITSTSKQVVCLSVCGFPVLKSEPRALRMRGKSPAAELSHIVSKTMFNLL